MSSISDKIEYLKETKRLFKQWIIDQQGTVTDTTPFRDYIDIIDAILTRGPIEPEIPDTWIDLLSVNAATPGGLKLKWAEAYETDGLYVWCANNMDYSSPGNENTWNSLCTLYLENGNIKLGLGNWADSSVSGMGLMWIFYDSSGSSIIGSTMAYEDYSITGSGSDWTIVLNSDYLQIPNNLGSKVTSAEGEAVVPSDILINEYKE